MNTFTHKGYGRIYVDKKENIEKIHTIIKHMDAFEYEYLPKALIATFDEYPKVVYTHKFSDLDLNVLTATCWKNGIHIWTYDTGTNDVDAITA